ncbi:helix-turn-helix domain-containing protein [Mucilaginibacter sp. McL0603]|uniref:helix-turn-helix domain-containing protein n=1 Tax=Mucilaginibacter sp. McL0603 TaxID=3415670 RepID=UPI003CF84F07
MEIDGKLPIKYSCNFSRSREGEQFVPEHTIGYIISGEMVTCDSEGTQTFKKGDLYFCRRNHLAKYTKIPPEGGDFRSVSMFFGQHILRNFSLEYGNKADSQVATPGFRMLPDEPALKYFMDSLRAYEPILRQKGTEQLLTVKLNEAVLILLKSNPDLKNILFDFSEPGKIDLEEFMEKNFHFNIDLERFAYLTGRSLSTFKRDFEKIYHMTPSRWLVQRRLQEAHYMIKEKKQQVSDVYLELGFENLSHFSFAFKKQYGISPSQL